MVTTGYIISTLAATSQCSYNLVYGQIYHHISINAVSGDGYVAYLMSLACRTSVCHSGVFCASAAGLQCVCMCVRRTDECLRVISDSRE